MSASPVSLSATGVLAVVGIGAAALLVWKGPALLKKAGDAINPLNHDNAIATGVNAVGGALVTDPAGAGKNADGSWSLGGWAYDVLHGGPVDGTSVAPAPVNEPATFDEFGNRTN